MIARAGMIKVARLSLIHIYARRQPFRRRAGGRKLGIGHPARTDSGESDTRPGGEPGGRAAGSIGVHRRPWPSTVRAEPTAEATREKARLPGRRRHHRRRPGDHAVLRQQPADRRVVAGAARSSARDGKPASGAAGGIEPVSYTHLDVYKRQGLERVAAAQGPLLSAALIGASASALFGSADASAEIERNFTTLFRAFGMIRADARLSLIHI